MARDFVRTFATMNRRKVLPGDLSWKLWTFSQPSFELVRFSSSSRSDSIRVDWAS